MLSDKSIIRNKPNTLPRRTLLYARKKASVMFRNHLNDEMRDTLKDVGAFTIFSNNCLGGVFYHDIGRQFNSPLINTALDGKDFIRFVSNPQHYLNTAMEFFTWPGRDFPIARIDDIEVNFVHYKTERESMDKWHERGERIIWNRIFIIATDNDGMYQDECLAAFNELPYKNKIMFVAVPHPEYPWAIPIRQFKNRTQCLVSTSFADFKGHRYYETAFDIPKWIKECYDKDSV